MSSLTTDEALASATFPGLVLLCVDLQPTFLRVIPEAESLKRRCAFAIQVALGLRLPVLFTEQVPEKLGRTDAELLALVPQPLVFGKRTFSALGDEAVSTKLQSIQVEHVLLMGIETPVCVYQTALDLIVAGTQVTVLSDCIGARRNVDAAVCLQALVRAGAHVLPSEAVFYSLLRDVNHPLFKTFTQLVKQSG